MPLLEPLHPIDAGVLNIAYHQAGPADGPPVLLMHGFPYDIHAYAEVAPQGLALLGVGLLAVDARSRRLPWPPCVIPRRWPSCARSTRCTPARSWTGSANYGLRRDVERQSAEASRSADKAMSFWASSAARRSSSAARMDA